MFKLENGTKVKSNVSGFCGVITARAEHLYGCARYWLQPPVDKEGKQPDGMWFDEDELDIVELPKKKKTPSDRGGFPSKIK